jgi:(p)ppGpp synthase/HD superfamily hydrolase
VVVDDEDGKSTQQAVAGCYQIIAVIHRMWRPIPLEFDDYISNPKATGYQSLHTAVFGPDGVPLEVQLRTRSMHETSEYGKTAHWIYKEAPSAAPVKKIITAAVVSQQLEAEAESQRRREMGLPEGWVKATDPLIQSLRDPK